MGNGAVRQTAPPSQDPCDIFAFTVAQAEFQRISRQHQQVDANNNNISSSDNSSSSSNNDSENNPATANTTTTFTGTEEELNTRLLQIFESAKLEYETLLEDCRCPAVVIHKYGALDTEAKKTFHAAIVNYLLDYEKANASANNKKKSATTEDYSKSFGGTADDTKNEKEAANILRGGDAEGSSSNPHAQANATALHSSCPFMIPPTIGGPLDKVFLRRASVWKKYMGGMGCYMYVNVLTKEIVSRCPEDEIVEPDENELNTANDGAAEAVKDPANDLLAVTLAELPAAIDRIINEQKKTPLVLDPRDVGARAYFTYKAVCTDVSAMTVPFAKSGLKRNDVVDNCRKSLVAALKTGRLFAMYMGAMTIEHADWKKKLCKKVIIFSSFEYHFAPSHHIYGALFFRTNFQSIYFNKEGPGCWQRHQVTAILDIEYCFARRTWSMDKLLRETDLERCLLVPWTPMTMKRHWKTRFRSDIWCQFS
jgi:hypothetical protein